MGNIATIPGSARIQTQQIGVQMDNRARIKALGQAAQTFSAGAEAVVDATGAIAEYEQKKRKAEEVAAFNNASILTRKTTSAFRDGLRNNPNDLQWVDNWTKTAQDTRAKILADPNLKGPAKTKMSQVLDRWQGDTIAEFQTAADVAGSDRRKRIGLLAANEALKDGNEGAATAAIDGLVKTGDMWKEDGEKLKTTFKATIQENQIRSGMDSNPVATLKLIDSGKFPSVPKSSMETLRRQTQTAIAKQQNAGRDAFLKRLDDGDLIRPEEIKQAEDAGTLTPKGAEAINNRIAQKGLKDAKDDFHVGMMQATEHKWTEDKSPEETARSMKDDYGHLPTALRQRLYKEIDSQVNSAKKQGERDENPIEKQTFDAMREDREKGGSFIPLITTTQKAPWYEFWQGSKTSTGEFAGGMTAFRKQLDGMSSDDIKAAFGPDATAKKVIDAEQLQYARKTAQMRDWFKANPKASVDEADAYRQSLEAPAVMDAVKQSIVAGPSIETSEPNISKEDYAKLKTGDTYWWNGEQHTKR